MDFPILNVRDLTKSYATGAGRLTVLHNVSFTLQQGATCSILGPSGSGKTTLLGLAAGLDLPTSGSVLLNGIALAEITEDERARVRNAHVGFVFQNFQLIPTLTALENVTVPMDLRGDRGARILALDLLKRVGLGERSTHYPAQLSGGEQQRVALARAFINRPKVLFADEPTAHPASPDRDLERARAATLVRTTLDRLPFKQREVFVLYELEELEGPQIAELLAIPVNTVWTRLHHARKRFQELIRKHAKEGT